MWRLSLGLGEGFVLAYAITVDAFDARYGTDTAGVIPIPWHRRLFQRGGWHAVHYATVREDKIRALLDPWPRQWTLIDLGCGKGRTLIIGAQLGFRVYGVEFQPALAAIARRNLTQLGYAATVITGDARTVALPNGPLLVYLYNPFHKAVMTAVATRLRQHPSDVVAMYVNPYCADAFADWKRLPLTEAQAALFSPQSVLLVHH